MNFFKIVLDAVNIIGILKKKPTPETGKKLVEAAGSLFTAGVGVNSATAATFATYPEETFEQLLKAWEISPVLGSLLITGIILINAVPHVAALVFKVSGDSQVAENPDVVVAE